MVWAVLGLITSILPFTIWSVGRVTRKLRLGSPKRPEINRAPLAPVTVKEGSAC